MIYHTRIFAAIEGNKMSPLGKDRNFGLIAYEMINTDVNAYVVITKRSGHSGGETEGSKYPREPCYNTFGP